MQVFGGRDIRSKSTLRWHKTSTLGFVRHLIPYELLSDIHNLKTFGNRFYLHFFYLYCLGYCFLCCRSVLLIIASLTCLTTWKSSLLTVWMGFRSWRHSTRVLHHVIR